MSYFTQQPTILDLIFPTPEMARSRRGAGRYDRSSSLSEKVAKEIESFNKVLFDTDNLPTRHDDTTVIHVGKDVQEEDISVELSPDAKTLTIEVKKVDNKYGIARHMKQTYSSEKKFDYDNMHVDLLDGDLVIFAPYVEDSADSQPKIAIQHSPEIEESEDPRSNSIDDSNK